VHLLPVVGHPQAVVVSLALCLSGGAILLDESSVSRRPDDLAGDGGYSAELTEARN